MDESRWDALDILSMIILGLVGVSIPIYLLSLLGRTTIEATGVVFSLILTGSLVYLYKQQKDILDKQGSLMEIRYEPRLRIEGVGYGENIIKLELSNGGNGPIENLHLRCDLYTKSNPDADEYVKVDGTTFKNSDKEYYTLNAHYSSLRRETYNITPGNVTITKVRKTVGGTYVDADLEPVEVETEVYVARRKTSNEHGQAEQLHTVLNQLSESGVDEVKFYLTVVGSDMTGKTHIELVYGKEGININREFQSLSDIVQSQIDAVKLGIPDGLKDDIENDDDFPPLN